MRQFADPRDKKPQPETGKEKSLEETRQEQTDPNLTELKGFIDPNEKLEPEGTNNKFDE